MNMHYVSEVVADPSQQYWDLGLDYFKNGYNAQIALKNLWRRMPPPGDLDLLAAIVGNLYGNTFWSNSMLRMDSNILAQFMNAATGINLQDCTRAAQNAYRLWYGMLVRCNTYNDGVIPKGGSYTASPDVLLNGLVTLDPYDMITKWDQTVWSPDPGLKNNTYGRAQNKNLKVPIKNGKIKIYYTSNGFNQPPSSWTQLFTYDGARQTADLVNINEKKTIRPGERAACDAAFGFEPPGAGHYCLITCAQTEFFGNDPASISGTNWTNTSATTWITYNGAAGWHNVNVSTTGQEPMVFYNNDDQPARFQFVARARNVPDGSKIHMSIGDLDFNLADTIVAQDQEIMGEVTVPPNYNGVLEAHFPVLPDDASISFSLNWLVEPDHPAKDGVMGLLHDGYATQDGDDLRIALGDTHFVGATQ